MAGPKPTLASSPRITASGASRGGATLRSGRRIVPARQYSFPAAWRDRTTGEDVLSCTVIVSDASEWIKAYHDRMPVVLDDVEPWLSLDTLLDEIAPLAPEQFTVRSVNRAVNKVSEKNLQAIEAAPITASGSTMRC